MTHNEVRRLIIGIQPVSARLTARSGGDGDYASVIPTNADHQDLLSFVHLRVLQFPTGPEQQSD
jgi:hypothetical protein